MGGTHEGGANAHLRDKTIARSLTKTIPNAMHVVAIQDAVIRMNRIKLHAGQLITMHLHRVLDEGLPIPRMTQSFFAAACQEVSTIPNDTNERREIRAVDQRQRLVELQDTAVGLDFGSKPSRSGLTQMICQESILMKAEFETNIRRHLRTRLKKFVWLAFHTTEARVMSPIDYKHHKINMLKVCSDLCAKKNATWESPEEFHPWIRTYRELLGISRLLEKDTCSLECVADTSPELFLPMMRRINRLLEGCGAKQFSIAPMKHSLRPGFVAFDSKTCREVLHLPEMPHRRAQARASKAARRVTANDESQKKKRKMDKEERQQEKRQALEAKRAARQEHLATMNAAQKKAFLVEEKQQNEERKAERAAAQFEKRQVHKDEKDAFYKGFLQLPPSGRGFDFAHSFKTDGVSVRLLFRRVGRTNASSGSGWKAKGIFTMDELKHLSRTDPKELRVIGVDPGMHDLIHCIDADDVHRRNLKKDAGFKYTRGTRNFETMTSGYRRRLIREERVAGVSDWPRIMSDFSRRSGYADRVSCYFDARRMACDDGLQTFYEKELYRVRRWFTFKRSQRALESLVTRMKARFEQDDGRQTVLAYGAWSNASFHPRGLPPCIGMGLRRHLSKHFVVVTTPEQYTSQTCSCCLGKVGPFSELVTQRRAELLARATNNAERHKAMHHDIRGIRRCQNAECGAILNRDRNGAACIALNFERLLSDQEPIRPLTADDQELERLTALLHA